MRLYTWLTKSMVAETGRLLRSVYPAETMTCLQRWKKVLKPGLRKGVWDKKEDAILIELYHAEVERCKQLTASGVTLENASENNIAKKRGINWAGIATQIEGRTTKQCRERWNNHLDPTIRRGNWTPDEDRLLLAEQNGLATSGARYPSY